MENDGVCWGRLAPSGAAGHSNRLVFTPFSSGCAPRSRSSLEPTCVIKSNAISQKLCQSAACGGGGAAERGGNNSLSRYGFVRNRQPAGATGTPTESLLDEYAEAWCRPLRWLRVPSGKRADLYLSTKCDFVRSRAGRRCHGHSDRVFA